MANLTPLLRVGAVAAGRSWRATLAARMGVATVLAVGTLSASSCASESPASQGSTAGSIGEFADAGLGSVHPRFEPAADPMPFGAIAWPDDLYLDALGRVTPASLPGDIDSTYSEALRSALGDLDGFGVLSPVYFFFDGDIDVSTLPVDGAASLEDDASVFLIDADTASPTAFERLPVTFVWDQPGQRLAVKPAAAQPLVPGRRYAAVVTRKLGAADGSAVEAAPRFAAVRSPDVMLDDALLLEARARYAPVIETLVVGGLARRDIVGLAVFRVQTVDGDLAAAREIVRGYATPSPAITDVISGSKLDGVFGKPPAEQQGVEEGTGALHDHLIAIVQGTLPSPNFLSATAKVHGAFERDETGELRVKRVEDVPFTLFWPKQPAHVIESAGVPLVIYQHGLDRERSDGVILANRMAARGFAVIAIDAPFHGGRAPGSDEVNRFTGKEGPDGFGDAPGDFVGASDELGALAALHPFYARDALRQGAVDLMSVVRSVELGDWSELATRDPALKGVAFDTAHLGFVGVDIGAQMGVLLGTREPSLGAFVLGFAGGGITQNVVQSPAGQTLFAALAQLLGRDPATNDAASDPAVDWPELALYQTLVDRGEPLAYAPLLRRSRANVLLLMARDDEVVSNGSTEALAHALGATAVGAMPRYVPELQSSEAESGAALGGNFSLLDDRVTRLLVQLDTATHDALTHRHGSLRYSHPPLPPFERLKEDAKIANPTAATLDQISAYLDEWYHCAASATHSAPCAAPVYVQ